MAKGKKAATAATAAPTIAAAGKMDLPEGIKAKRVVTLPSFAIKKPGESRTVKILDAMRVSKIVQKADEKGKTREPATICTVVDLATGEQATMIVAAVVKANLERDYAGEKYVGLSFYIKNLGKRTESQRYNDFQIVEVE